MIIKLVENRFEREKDVAILKSHVRYLQFYFAVIYVLSILSYLLDLLFFRLDGKSPHYQSDTVIAYIFVFILRYMYVTVPLILAYNYCVNNFLVPIPKYRIVFGAVVGALIGLAIGGKGVGLSFYIGKYRGLKHLLVFMLAGILVELIRILVVKMRLKKLNNSTTSAA